MRALAAAVAVCSAERLFTAPLRVPASSGTPAALITGRDPRRSFRGVSSRPGVRRPADLSPRMGAVAGKPPAPWRAWVGCLALIAGVAAAAVFSLQGPACVGGGLLAAVFARGAPGSWSLTRVFATVVGAAMCYAYPPLLAVPALFALLKVSFDSGSRPYVGGLQEENSVGSAYDEWTADGILEYYWGEHIHLGYYTEEEQAKGYLKKDFVQAKYDFVDRMMEWGGVDKAIAESESLKILDCGCGIGGTSRYLAKKVGNKGSVTGITLSKEQVKRGMQLCAEREISNCELRVMDALNMEFPDNTFDVVWACESGEHMPDKKRYVEEMTRVLKPGGKIVIATWCQRDGEFKFEEKKALDFLYTEWAHPFFISIQDYVKLLGGTDAYSTVGSADWAVETLPSWRHSIWVGVFDPWPVVMAGPKLWWKTIRDGVCIERMHRAFDRGLMEYGMVRGSKAQAVLADAPDADAQFAEA